MTNLSSLRQRHGLKLLLTRVLSLPLLVQAAEPLPSWLSQACHPITGKPYIGRRPILAFGNLPMLQWTAAGPGKRFMGLVHHTDAAPQEQVQVQVQ